MIDYLYTGSIQIEDMDTGLILALCGNEYGVPDLKEKASTYLRTTLRLYDKWFQSKANPEPLPLERWKEIYDVAEAVQLDDIIAIVLHNIRTKHFFTKEYVELFTSHGIYLFPLFSIFSIFLFFLFFCFISSVLLCSLLYIMNKGYWEGELRQ
jgi:hypothetical protein